MVVYLSSSLTLIQLHLLYFNKTLSQRYNKVFILKLCFGDKEEKLRSFCHVRLLPAATMV